MAGVSDLINLTAIIAVVPRLKRNLRNVTAFQKRPYPGPGHGFMEILTPTKILDIVANLLRYIAFAAGVGLFFASFPTYAASVTLAWNPSPDPTVVGYIILYGNSSGSFSQSINVGSSNSATVADLTPGITYLFVVAAYDATGLQSAPSNQISFEPNFTSVTGSVQNDNGSQWIIKLLVTGPTTRRCLCYGC